MYATTQPQAVTSVPVQSCTVCAVATCTVEPPNKGQVGDNINSAVLSFIERLSSFRGSKCTKTIGHVIFGTSNSVLCREAYYTVSLFRRVHYQRFHCIQTAV